MSVSPHNLEVATDSLLSEIEVRAQFIYKQGLTGIAPENVSLRRKSLKQGLEVDPVVRFLWGSMVASKEDELAVSLRAESCDIFLRRSELLEGGGFNTNIYDLNIAASGLVTYTHEVVHSRQHPEYIAFEEHEVPHGVASQIHIITRNMIVA